MRAFPKSLNVAGTGPCYGEKTPPLHVGRGPVPRHRPRNPTIAGDRPPRYGWRKDPLATLVKELEMFPGPRATGGEKTPPHRRARACPSPCPGLRSNHPWSLGCGRFPQRSRDRGGQAPALRVEKRPLLRRRAWALACHTRMREGFPRQHSRYGKIETRRSPLPGSHRVMKHPQLFFPLCVDRVAPSAATRL